MGDLPAYEANVLVPEHEEVSELSQDLIRLPSYSDICAEGLRRNSIYKQQIPPHVSSTAQVVTHGSGILSFDPILRDPTELWNFLVANQTRPKVSIRVRGYHKQTYVDSEGLTQTRYVTDFSFKADLSHLVCEWHQIVTMSDLTIQDLLKEFTDSRANVKQMVLRKVVNWRTGELINAILNIIEPTGYQGEITASIKVKNKKIRVNSTGALLTRLQSRSTSTVSKFLVQRFAVPVLLWFGKKMDYQLFARFRLRYSEAEYCRRIQGRILYILERGIVNAIIPATQSD